MDRRGSVRALIGLGVTATSPVAKAQQGARVFRIGFVAPTSSGPRNAAFVEGLRELGYVEGRNVAIAMRFADGVPERLPRLVEEVIRSNIDVLVVGSTIGANAAKKATSTIPIVFAGSSDPVAGGVVANLARPGGNITGVSLAYGGSFAGKWLELLKAAAPDVAYFAALWSSSSGAAPSFVAELRDASRALKVKLDVHNATNVVELDAAFATIGSGDARGLIVTPSPFASTNRDKLVAFAASRRLPAIYFIEDFVDVGGLMSYGPSVHEAYRRAAGYVDKILKGAKPGDLAVEQPTKYQLVINLKTARALGLSMPQSLLLRADEVVQ